jgi:Zn finger protein HypA/HybF involved in hydrogenase expression
MYEKNKSAMWSISKDEFQKIFDESETKIQIMQKLGYKHRRTGMLTERIIHDNINLSKFRENSKNYFSRINSKSKKLDNILIKDQKMKSANLKKKLYKSALLKEKCLDCGIGNVWNNKPIVLQLDHINGDNKDNRIENLRILCPNCHSQTDTFDNKIRPGQSSKQKLHAICLDCGKQINKTSARCNPCSSKFNNVKYKETFKVTKEELEKLVWEMPLEEIGKSFRVSGRAISKRCKKYEINRPTQGYWLSKAARSKNNYSF